MAIYSEAWALQDVEAKRAERVRGRILKARHIEAFGHSVTFGAVRRQNGIAGADEIHARSGNATRLERKAGLTSRTYSRATGNLKGKALLSYLERQPYSLF